MTFLNFGSHVWASPFLYLSLSPECRHATPLCHPWNSIWRSNGDFWLGLASPSLWYPWGSVVQNQGRHSCELCSHTGWNTRQKPCIVLSECLCPTVGGLAVDIRASLLEMPIQDSYGLPICGNDHNLIWATHWPRTLRDFCAPRTCHKAFQAIFIP